MTRDTNKMFLKKATLRILFSDILLSNFFILKHAPPNFSSQLFREKTHSRILPILSILVGKEHIEVMELRSNGNENHVLSELVNKVLLLRTCAVGFVFDGLVKVLALLNVDP